MMKTERRPPNSGFNKTERPMPKGAWANARVRLYSK